ncbi:hypothetical protein GE09DRAFT_313431 [Coniochaeta sp. 2T2.1]|nr:hypothetical protein GE09DRAFT_313431 [Coniochaeta sp. 2T2.1]
MSARSNNTLVLIGSGPGIGRSVASLFAAKRYNRVALIARNSGGIHLEEDRKAVQAASSPDVVVKTYVCDVTDTEALLRTLDAVEADLGTVECIYFNAARIFPQPILEHPWEEIEYDWKTTCEALYATARWGIPKLVDLAKADETAKPALLVTNSLLYEDPIPFLFALSMTKAAQRNLVQSLALIYAKEGVHIGVVSVGDSVNPKAKNLNPGTIAARTWEWFAQSREKQTFEVRILESD